jgi:two-component system, NarL family, response regulator LiaR
MREKISLLLADDHALLRQGTAELLQREPDIEILGEADNGEEAIALARTLHPDIIIMDVRMPLLSGVEATRRIRSEMPEIQVLVLTAYDDDQYIFSLLQAGASGYLLKTAPIGDLVKAIHQVRAGESPLAPAIARKVVARMTGKNAHSENRDSNNGAGDSQQVESLTTRELEILQFLARGSSNRDIADALFISERTVQAHLTNIFAKMRVSSRLEAVLKAIRLGWLTLDL